jgi:hypothetical protein
MIDANRIATFPTTSKREHLVFIRQPRPVMTDAERDAYVAANVTFPKGWAIAGVIATRSNDSQNPTGWNIRVRFVPAN